ncbi:hypothetical protein EK904_006605 [Melospiza melodia maxima]|nr:hypothetical protein EK904_006605 [Melospiza melodia maxima]
MERGPSTLIISSFSISQGLSWASVAWNVASWVADSSSFCCRAAVAWLALSHLQSEAAPLLAMAKLLASPSLHHQGCFPLPIRLASGESMSGNIKFSKKMCLEHDQRLISYLSMLRDIEMRIKRVQPAEQNLAALHDLRQQAEALGSELQELSCPVNQELDAVQRIVANPPEEVPEQLLKALEKDAKNLQKSLSSASEVLQSRLQNLRGAAEAEKAKILAQHEALEGRLQELLSWVRGTTESLDDRDFQQATDGSSLGHCLQHYKVAMAMPLILQPAELAALCTEEKLLILQSPPRIVSKFGGGILGVEIRALKALRAGGGTWSRCGHVWVIFRPKGSPTQPENLLELKEPLAGTKAELDAAAFDIQLLISEHAQDLTPQQSRQLLRLLNELQRAFRELSERVAARLEVLQLCLQQAEQTEQVKVVRHLLLCLLKRFPATGTAPPLWDFPCMPLSVQGFSLHIMSFL